MLPQPVLWWLTVVGASCLHRGSSFSCKAWCVLQPLQCKCWRPSPFADRVGVSPGGLSASTPGPSDHARLAVCWLVRWVLGPQPATRKGAFDSRHSQSTFRLHGIAQHRSINDSQHIARVGKVVHHSGRSLGRALQHLDRVLAGGHLVHKARSTTSSSMQFTTHSWHTTYTGKRWRAKRFHKM